jgi:hypothetical protein
VVCSAAAAAVVVVVVVVVIIIIMIILLLKLQGHAMVQVVSRWLPIVTAWI